MDLTWRKVAKNGEKWLKMAVFGLFLMNFMDFWTKFFVSMSYVKTFSYFVLKYLFFILA